MVQTLNMNEVKNEDLEQLLYYIKSKRGVDLSSYRKKFVMRRLSLRMNMTNAEGCQDYINLVKKSPDEFNKFLDTLSINVSAFFRDAEVFAAFREKALADLILRDKTTNRRIIRVWSAGCSFGEEAYSLAILIKEGLEKEQGNFIVKIWATDVDEQALEEARIAEYKASSLDKVNKNWLEKYFVKLSNGSYKLKDEIKQMVQFTKHSLISDPPLKNMDIIFCRNVMIYLTRKQQDALFRNFSQALNPKGYLVIGKVEILWNNSGDLFIPVDICQRIYQKQGK